LLISVNYCTEEKDVLTANSGLIKNNLINSITDINEINNVLLKQEHGVFISLMSVIELQDYF